MTEQNSAKKEQYDLEKEQERQEKENLAKTKRTKRTLVWAVFIVFLAVVVWGLSRLSSETPQDIEQAQIPDNVSETDWITGNRESGVTLIEYSDFQCPACRAYHPLVLKLIQEQGANFMFIYRHFPLQQHKNARPAAYAAEAAGFQGKFWEMEAKIFEGQTDWSNSGNAEEIFADYARELSLNMEQFEKNRDSGETKEKVNSDYESGIKAGVNATPTFYLNGVKIQPQSYEEFESMILKWVNIKN